MESFIIFLKKITLLIIIVLFFKDECIAQVNKDKSFSMIMASDPQWPWVEKSWKSKHPNWTKIQKEKQADKDNKNHVKSMNSLISSLKNVKGVIINGDLTAYGHSKELNKFKSIYRNLKAPMYLGLGNHDYQNNVNKTLFNQAAIRMFNYMDSHIKKNGSNSNDIKRSESYEFPTRVKNISGSLAYSWDIKNVHFVQLQNYPGYEKKWAQGTPGGVAKVDYKYTITSSMSWLKNNLAKARKKGKIIILNFHDCHGHWKDNLSSSKFSKLKKEFKKILEKYKVGAVFVGHYHSKIGKAAHSNPDDIATHKEIYGSTPVFYCGSASYNKYLLVNFDGNQMAVQHVSSKNGKAKKSNFRKYILYDKAKNVSVPKKDGVITVFNQAGYVSKYTITYTLKGKKKTIKTGNMNLGNKKRYTIPGTAKKIRIRGYGKTGLVWNPWKKTFDKKLKSPKNICYKSYGTTLNQKWNNNCK